MSKKRKVCKSVAPMTPGFRCTKDRNHVSTEIDVVHKHGMLVWRDDPTLAGQIQFYTTSKPTSSIHTKDGSDLTDEPLPPGMFRFSAPVIDPLKAVVHNYELAFNADHDFLAEGGVPAMEFPDPEAMFQPLHHGLTEWWLQQAHEEIDRTVPKAIEYSSTDLMDIGHDLARGWGREVDDEEAAELGVFFYLRGKVARWVGAVTAGHRVSDDTLFDIGVYVRMAQRIRFAGGWPGIEKENE